MSSHLDRKSFVNKGFIKGFRRIFSWHMADSFERARSLHLACLGIQSQCVIWFILPAHGACHIIKVLSVHKFGDNLSVRHHYQLRSKMIRILQNVLSNGDYEHETGFSLKKNSLCDVPIIRILPVQNFFPSSVEFVHLHSAIFMELDVCTNTSKVRLIDRQ